jgi:hypothetical protein
MKWAVLGPCRIWRVQDIYRYLKTRADGVPGPDKPGLMKE